MPRPPDPLEHRNDAPAIKAALDLRGQTLSGVVVHDHQDPQPSSACKRIVHEIERPAFVRCVDRSDDVAANVAYLALLAWTDLQAKTNTAESRFADAGAFAPHWNKQPASSPLRMATIYGR